MPGSEKKSMEIPAEVKSLMYQTWLPALMSSLIAGIKELPREHREALLTKMCVTCEELAMAGAVGIQPGMNWEDYQEYVKQAAPPIGPWTIKEDGDVYDLIYDASIGPDGKYQCHCPLLHLGIMNEAIPFCCDSGARLSGKMIGAATGEAIESTEVIDSPSRTGAACCHYRVHVKCVHQAGSCPRASRK